MIPDNENKSVSKHEVSAPSNDILNQKADSLLPKHEELKCQAEKVLSHFSKNTGCNHTADVTSEHFFKFPKHARIWYRTLNSGLS